MAIQQRSSNPAPQTIHAAVAGGHSLDDPGLGSLLPELPSFEVGTKDARRMLAQIASAYPEIGEAVQAVDALIVHLETLRHEAQLPLALGNLQNVRQLLSQPAVVRVQNPFAARAAT